VFSTINVVPLISSTTLLLTPASVSARHPTPKGTEVIGVVKMAVISPMSLCSTVVVNSAIVAASKGHRAGC
jgi:hypothetical protein